MSRRQRRRAKARVRDAYIHGYAIPRLDAPKPRPQYRADRTFRDALPDVPRPVAKGTVPVHEVIVLQTLTARGTGEHTKGKRHIRYRAVSLWRGTRLAPKP